MDCRETQESMLESLVEPIETGRRQAMENHIATCENCRDFAELQHTLDTRLAAALPPACPSADFRAALRKRIRRDPVPVWPDFLPDLAHLAGCALATGVAAFVLPVPAVSVILAGAAFTGVTYFLQTVLRTSLEWLEGDA